MTNDRPDTTAKTAPPLLVRDLASRGLVSTDGIWRLLPGGRTNQVWSVADKTGERIVKFYRGSANTPLFRNDPQAEALVLDVLKDSGISPRPIFSATLPSGTVLVYENQAGQPWRTAPQTVGTLLRKLHAIACSDRLGSLPKAPDGSEELVTQTRSILAQIPSGQSAQIRALEPRIHVPPSRLRNLLHGDPVPDNIVCPDIASAGLPVLIDWQCPALGDPVLDLALFLSPAMQVIGRGKPLSENEKTLFLQAYGDPAANMRLTALMPVLHWRMAAYCLWKMTRERPDPTYAPALVAEIAALRCLPD